MDSIIDQLAEEHDVEPSEAYAAAGGRPRAELRRRLDPDQAEAALAGAGQRALPRRHPRPRSAARPSRRTASPTPSVDDALARGNDVLSTWLAANPPGSTRSTTSRGPPQAGSVDTTTSHAVTTAAVDAHAGRPVRDPRAGGTRTSGSAPTSAACPRRSAAADAVAGDRPAVRGQRRGRAARGDAPAARRVRLEGARRPTGRWRATCSRRPTRPSRRSTPATPRATGSTCARSSATCCCRSTSTP